MGTRKLSAFRSPEITLAAAFHSFSHPCRVRIIASIALHGSRTVGELVDEFESLAQSSASQHVHILRENGLLTGYQVENSIRYRLQEDRWEEMKACLTAFLDEEYLKSLA